MASMHRKVSFYFLSQERTDESKKKHAVDNNGIEENFKGIYSKMSVLKDNNRATKVMNSNVNFVVEVIEYNSEGHYAFIKIGQQNHANTASLRDQNTLEATSVPMSPTQKLELFTYCYIDFTTSIVSYISLNGAPRIGALRALLDQYLLKDFHISSSLSAIMSSDIIEMLQKKRISKLTVSVAVPSDDVLSTRIGVDRNTFDELQFIRKRNISYTLSAQRLKNMFNTPGVLGKVVARLKEQHGTDLKSLKVNAKGDGEDTQVYDLLQYSLTKKVAFDVEDISLLTTTDFMNTLVNSYRATKPDLIRYIPSQQ